MFGPKPSQNHSLFLTQFPAQIFFSLSRPTPHFTAEHFIHSAATPIFLPCFLSILSQVTNNITQQLNHHLPTSSSTTYTHLYTIPYCRTSTIFFFSVFRQQLNISHTPKEQKHSSKTCQFLLQNISKTTTEHIHTLLKTSHIHHFHLTHNFK